MRVFLFKLLVQTLSILAVAAMLPGVKSDSILAAALVALFLGLINSLIRPILLFLTFPFTIVTLGFFIFFINGFCFWLAAELVPGFSVTGVFSAVVGAVLISAVSWIIHMFFTGPAEPSRGKRRHQADSIKIIKAKVVS